MLGNDILLASGTYFQPNVYRWLLLNNYPSQENEYFTAVSSWNEH